MESCGRGPLKWPCLHQIDFQCYSESSACAIVGCPDSSNPSKETNLSQPIFYLHTLVTIMSKIQIGLDARFLKVPIERATMTHTILSWADLGIINAFTLSIKSQIWKGPLFPHRVKLLECSGVLVLAKGHPLPVLITPSFWQGPHIRFVG